MSELRPAPPWLAQVVARSRAAGAREVFERFAPPDTLERHSAVLILFGPSIVSEGVGSGEREREGVGLGEGVGEDERVGLGEGEDRGDGMDGGEGVQVVLTARSRTLRSHPGQVSFPGGHLDPGDDGLVGAALREAQEEVGVDPRSVEVIGELPPLFLTPSSSAVTPVLGWWPDPVPLRVVDPAEVEAVRQVRVSDLLDPANRFTVLHPSGYEAPGFEAGGLFVWGFTALLLDTVFSLAGLTQPWDATVTREVPDRVVI